MGDWQRASLGLAVKEIFAEHFGVSLEFIEEWKVREDIPTGFDAPIRMGLTTIGDAWRNIKRDIWIQKLFSRHRGNLVISDCRYINEAEHIQANNGVTILVWRPGHENTTPSRSEQELMPFVYQLVDYPEGPIKDDTIPFDLWLKNDGSLKEWFGKIEDIVIPYFFSKMTKYAA
jgi:hypothetical protein